MKTKMITLCGIVVALGSPALAATSGIHLKGYVPVTCKVRVANQAAAIKGEIVELGGVREFCNAPGGYDVFLDYSNNFRGTTLLVDGEPVELTKDGSVKFAGEDGPALRERALALDIGKSKGKIMGGAISFRIVAR
jgi:hypothetical protein